MSDTMFYDVFNGDADGICALHQLRLAAPRPARLITGVKRDIQLLRRLQGVEGATITVLDISLDSNRSDLVALLASCKVFYADHHYAGEIPESPHLEAHIDASPDVCTSLIVDRLLLGRFRSWAVAAAFGDNLHAAAIRAAADLGISEQELARLRELGELLNYNGYGKTVADLHFAPDALYEAIRPFADPFAFMAESEVLGRLRAGFADDMERARKSEALLDNAVGRVYAMPAESWARRAAGVFSNEKAREMPGRAHALLVDNGDKTFTVSVRAPLERKEGADRLCRRFPTGGGRAAAAGINALPAAQREEFVKTFQEVFTP